MLSLDRYSSHINVHKSLKLFAEYNICVVKEEGDTSQVNQAYNQAVTRSDKRVVHYLIGTVCNHSKKVLSNFYLITIVLHSLKTVTVASWLSSFKIVNIHPNCRISFAEWLIYIESQLYTISPDMQTQVFNVIQEFYGEAL